LGIVIGEDGYSQMALEDIACMRTLPGMAVLQPGDDIETKQMMRYLVDHKGPVYIRLTRQNLEPLHDANYKFKFGKGDELKKGKDAVVFATGGVTGNSLRAAEALEKEGMSVGVVNIHTIKPFDTDLVLNLSKTVKHVFSAEDHNVIGGLGSAVAETLATYGLATKLTRIGVQDTYGESGSPEALYEKHALDINGIARTIKSVLKN
jgi:transketolase